MDEREHGNAFAFTVPGWHSIGFLAVCILGSFLMFGAFGDFDRVATVSGILIPATGVARISAPAGGIVTQILAREGDHVRRGQALLKIGSEAILPNGMPVAKAQLNAIEHQLRAAREAGVAGQQQAAAQRAELIAETAKLASGLASNRAEIGLQRERIANNEARLRSLGSLRAKGFVSEATFLAQQETVLSLRQELVGLTQKDSDTHHVMAELRARLDGLGADVHRTRLQSESMVRELERGEAAFRAADETTLAASITGRIAVLRVSSGAALKGGEEVAVLVPESARLEAMLFAPSSSVGSVHVGQPVKLRFDAFPYQRFGIGGGVVRAVAAAGSDESGASSPRTFRIRVVIVQLPPSISASALRPDINLAGSIVLERRSLLDWLIAPAVQSWRERRDRAGAP